MSADAWVALVTALTLLWSIIAFFWLRSDNKDTRRIADRADERAQGANLLAAAANGIAEKTGVRISAEAEIAVLSLINMARIKTNENYAKMNEVRGQVPNEQLSDEQKKGLRPLINSYEDSIEILLNSYELACGLYLDGGKLDNERFKRQYSGEIRRLFEFNEYFANRLQPFTSPYTSIRKVYEQWHNLEKDRQ